MLLFKTQLIGKVPGYSLQATESRGQGGDRRMEIQSVDAQYIVPIGSPLTTSF